MADEPTNDVPGTPAAATPPADPSAPAAPETPAADPLMDILTEGTDDPTKPASSTGKDEKNPPVESKPDGAEGNDIPTPPEVPTKPTDDADKSPGGDESPADPAKPDEGVQPQGKGEQRKQQLNGEIRDLVAQRNALKTDIEKINAEYYQPATVDELVASGMNPLEARVTASEQRQEVADYNNKVAEAQLVIESEAQRVLTDFPIFDPNSQVFKDTPGAKALYDEAAELFNDSLIHDENTGQIIGTTMSPYKLYKALAVSHNVSAQNGQLAGQKSRDEMLARADSSPDAAPKVAKKDPILAILEDVDGN